MTCKAKILIVEDEYLTAIEICGLIEASGHTAIGPVSTLDGAIDLLERERPDIAVLDFILHGVQSSPVCELLSQMKIPFGFVTGTHDREHET
jgi:DNA-binding response OmpR family regulator